MVNYAIRFNLYDAQFSAHVSQLFLDVVIPVGHCNIELVTLEDGKVTYSSPHYGVNIAPGQLDFSDALWNESDRLDGYLGIDDENRQTLGDAVAYMSVSQATWFWVEHYLDRFAGVNQSENTPVNYFILSTPESAEREEGAESYSCLSFVQSVYELAGGGDL